MKKNITILEGIHNFPENEEIIKQHKRPAEYLNIEEFNPYYHGPKREECLLVKFRREKTYDNHYLDIYLCLSHQKECCRCGMEWDYYLNGLYDKTCNPKKQG